MATVDTTGTTNYYDRWCYRSIILTRVQFVLVLTIALTICLQESTSFMIGRDPPYPVWPVWEKVVAIAPVCLAAININIRSTFRRFAEYRSVTFLDGIIEILSYKNELQRLPVFVVSQTLQFLLCTLLTTADFIRLKPTNNWWPSLVLCLLLWFLPAVLGFVHGVIGLHYFCSRCGPHIELGLSDIPPQYSDLDDDDGPLARAFRSQQDWHHIEDEEDTAEPAAIFLVDHELNEQRRPRKYWHRDAASGTVPSDLRFRWQEKLKNMKNGGLDFWVPFSASIGNTCLIIVMLWPSVSFVVGTKHDTPAFRRTFCNLILIPAVATFTSDVLLLLALYRPWFTIIFLSLCGTIIAAVMWITAFILMFLTLSGFINYLHMFSALMMAFFHCWLAYTPLRLEWDPDYDSFMRMFKRLRRNQWRMLNDE